MTVLTPSVDRASVAFLSDEEIDAYVRRVAEILARSSAPQAIDAFCARIEGLLERVDLVKSR
jgi:hypothetical protein